MAQQKINFKGRLNRVERVNSAICFVFFSVKRPLYEVC